MDITMKILGKSSQVTKRAMASTTRVDHIVVVGQNHHISSLKLNYCWLKAQVWLLKISSMMSIIHHYLFVYTYLSIYLAS